MNSIDERSRIGQAIKSNKYHIWPRDQNKNIFIVLIAHLNMLDMSRKIKSFFGEFMKGNEIILDVTKCSIESFIGLVNEGLEGYTRAFLIRAIL